MQKTWIQSLGQEDPLEEEMVAHSCVLACRGPWAEAPGQCNLEVEPSLASAGSSAAPAEVLPQQDQQCQVDWKMRSLALFPTLGLVWRRPGYSLQGHREAWGPGVRGEGGHSYRSLWRHPLGDDFEHRETVSLASPQPQPPQRPASSPLSGRQRGPVTHMQSRFRALGLPLQRPLHLTSRSRERTPSAPCACPA